MKIVVRNGIEMVELSDAEMASLEARLQSADDGISRTYTDEELDEKWQAEDAGDDRRRAA